MDNLTKKISEEVKWISSIGKDPDGGTTRLAFTESWLKAQNAIKAKYVDAGFKADFDETGNVVARLEGTKYPNEVIMTGSHIDTVKQGGPLDGQFGVIAAQMAMEHLYKTYGAPLRTIEGVSFAEEEGSRFFYEFWGSKNVIGSVSEEDVEDIVDADGVKLKDALAQMGFTFKPKGSKRTDIKAFVELHIEQGSVLEENNQSVGIVTDIIGQRRYNIILTGQSNHAGTTPMSYRKDAVEAFAKIAGHALESVRKAGDPFVLTIGQVFVEPNIVNVVPGKVQFSIDCRHINEQELKTFTDNLIVEMQKMAEDMGVGFESDMWMNELPVAMDKNIIHTIKEVCDKEHVNYRIMHSGAVHDSQIIAREIPTGMIFVPSKKGISHSPFEDTNPEDLAKGVEVLINTLYELAYKE